jgi:hypothetical protein
VGGLVALEPLAVRQLVAAPAQKLPLMAAGARRVPQRERVARRA